MVRTVVATTVVVVSLMFGVAAQGDRQPAPADAAIAALVNELRAVRAELVDSSQRNLRFQLLLARLQLQEQRIGHLDRQRAEVTKSLLDAGTMTTMFATQYQQFERGCREATGDERAACESQVETMKATATSHQTREQQLRQQEQDLEQAIATEQGRWAEFSSRLDDLERALTRR
jgi:hypothetical protein